MYDDDQTMDLPPDLMDPGQLVARCRAAGETVTSGPVPWAGAVPGDRSFLLVEIDAGSELAAPPGWTLERDDLEGERRRLVFSCRPGSAHRPPVELGAPYVAAQIQTWYVGAH